MPNQGRPILGCEKLLAQAIPYFSLNLGNETEVQLGDLAGNAMTLTVVCATLLAAITCKQLKTETEKSKHKDMTIILKQSFQEKDSLEQFLSQSKQIRSFENDNSFDVLLRSLAALAQDAIDSSIWCTVCHGTAKFHFVLFCIALDFIFVYLNSVRHQVKTLVHQTF